MIWSELQKKLWYLVKILSAQDLHMMTEFALIVATDQLPVGTGKPHSAQLTRVITAIKCAFTSTACHKITTANTNT